MWRWKVVTLHIPFVRCVHRNSIEHFIVLKVSIFTTFAPYVYFQSECVGACVCASMFTSKFIFISNISGSLFYARRWAFYLCFEYIQDEGRIAIKAAMWKWWETKIVISLQLQFEQLNSFFGISLLCCSWCCCHRRRPATAALALYASHLNMKRSTEEHFSTEMKMCNWNENIQLNHVWMCVSKVERKNSINFLII